MTSVGMSWADADREGDRHGEHREKLLLEGGRKNLVFKRRTTGSPMDYHVAGSIMAPVQGGIDKARTRHKERQP